MRLSKYTKSPIDFFLEQPIGDFYEWVKTMNKDVDLERKMQEQAARQTRRR